MQLQCNSQKNQTYLITYVCTMCINYCIKDPISTCNYNTIDWFFDMAIYLLIHYISKGIIA
jgi:hypothetical protein